jgi:cytoskeletal protein RodZ
VQQAPVTTQVAAAPTMQPAAPTTNVTNASSAANADAVPGVHIELHAREDSWMQVSADGRAPVEMTLGANQSKKFYAEKQLVMKFGNAEAIEVVRNGKPMPAFAPGTKTQTVTYKSEM